MNKKTLLIVISATLTTACLLLTGSGFFFIKNTSFNKSSVKSKAVIIELIESAGSSSGSNRKTYSPVFTYKDKRGKEYTKKSSYSSYPAIGNVGDSIEIMYNPDNPSQAKINTFFSNWGVPIILASLGIADLITGLIFLIILLKKPK